MSKVVLPLVLLALVVVGVVTFFFGGGHVKTLTAEFPRTVSIYQGSDVRVLGVPVGKIDSVTPSGTDVIVTMHYDADVQVPENAKAVIISPSIVGDRFVQLTPAYTGGPVLASGSTLTQDRTAVPLELDQIYSSLDDLTVALGPNGANKKGALTDLLDTWVAYYADHPKERALHAAASMEVDTEARVSVRTVIHRHYLEVLRPLVRDAHVRGDLRKDCDTDALLSLLLMIFPHMALAPYVRGLDPILGLDDPTPEQPALAVRRLVAVLSDAFSSTSPARMIKEVNQ